LAHFPAFHARGRSASGGTRQESLILGINISQGNFMKIISVLLMDFLLLAAAVRAQYANDRFDPGANSTVRTLALQSDGKILVGGDFTTLRGSETRNRIARIYADGRLDYDFLNTGGANTSVYCIAIQADGSIIVGGDFTTLAGQARNRIGRLGWWGNLDTSFDPGANSRVYALAVQSDGKILVGGSFTTLAGQTRYFGRLNTNGTLDASFSPNVNGYVRAIAVQSDGKIIIGGGFTEVGGQTRNFIARIKADGSLDNSFNPNASGVIHTMAIQADGKILVGGNFVEMSRRARHHIARLNTDGLLDFSFDPDANDTIETIALQADGKILVGGDFTAIGGNGKTNIARLNLDGTLDSGFYDYYRSAAPGANGTVRAIAVQADDKVLAGGDFTQLCGKSRHYIGRLYPDGIADQDFSIDANDRVYTIIPLTNWSFVVAGAYDHIWDYVCYRIAKADNNSVYWQNFCYYGANDSILSLMIQPDGKTLVAGEFTQLDTDERGHIGRVNADGSLDRSFQPRISGGDVNAMALQADGKILVGGSFTSLVGEVRTRIGRVSSAGALDVAFDPYCNGNVYSLALQPDGKIIVCGSFSVLTELSLRNNIGRLNSSGTLDLSFNPDVNSNVFCSVVQPDGKIIIAGAFTEGDGSLDDAYFPPDFGGNIFSLALQADGKLIVGGSFNSGSGNNIGRLYAGGTLDTYFGMAGGASGYVCSVTLQPDGKVWVGGNFNYLGGRTVSYFGRLSNNDAALQNLSVNDDGSIITWTRSGASPEIWRATFEQSTNNRAWTSLGSGTWSTNGWQLAELNLPTNQNVYIRARGYAVGGMYDGSGFFHESVRQVWISRPAVDITNVTGAVTTDYDVVSYTLSGTAYGEVVGNMMWWTNNQVCGGTLEGASSWSITNITLRAGINAISVYGSNDEGQVVSDSVNIIARRSIPLSADIDGDRLSDPMVYAGTNWYVWFSFFNYLKLPLSIYGIEGALPVAADFDGDNTVDLAVYSVTNWYFWRSSDGYERSGPYASGLAGGSPAAGFFDGDRKADPAIVYQANWYIWLSSLFYFPLGPFPFSVAGAASVIGDYDGDSKSDMAAYLGTYWYIWFSSINYEAARTDTYGIAGATPVAGDFDGDSLADPALDYEGQWYIWLSSMDYAQQGPFAFNLSP
jgi:uncharacterized delta-60 repeat protein